MSSKLYVGNVAFSATEDSVKALFSQAGPVEEVVLIYDRFTGKPRGFGFVSMATEEAANEAINRYNGYELDGRPLKVNLARPREERPMGEGGGGPRGGGGGGGGRFHRGGGGGRGPRDDRRFGDRAPDQGERM